MVKTLEMQFDSSVLRLKIKLLKEDLSRDFLKSPRKYIDSFWDYIDNLIMEISAACFQLKKKSFISKIKLTK